jgi:phenylacetate-CoA ligase
VRALVEHAYDTVPYYHEVMQARGLTPADVQRVADLPKLPILTKQNVRESAGRLRSVRFDCRHLVHGHTSGTTGTSLQFVHLPADVAFKWALAWRQRAIFGAHLGDLHVNFTGKPAAPPTQRRPPYWRRAAAMNQWIVSMHHVTPDKIADISAFLAALRPRFYSGYPSILAEAARLALERGLALPGPSRPGVVFAAAESTVALQERAITEWTGAPVSGIYGASEGCCHASRCEQGVYHEDFEYCHLERVGADGAPADGTRGEILCTGFGTLAMPFIRYAIGDAAEWAPPGYRCACGRQSTVLLQVEGRSEDYVITPEGRRIMRFDYVFKDTEWIREAQVCQYELGGVVVRMVLARPPARHEEAELRELFAHWISPTLDVCYERVAALEREANGKLRPVKSYLPREQRPPCC